MSALRRNLRRSPRRDTESVPRTLAKSLATIAFVGAVLYVGLTSYNGVPGRQYGTVYAEVPGVGNLIRHDPVRIAGVRVGQVEQIGLTERGRPRIRLQIEPNTDIPSDTGVAVRANGLLGARYVQLVPGTSATPLADGGTITADRDALSFGIADALDTFDAKTRTRLGDTLDGLGEGLLGQGENLNDSLRVLAPAVPRFSSVMRAITARPGSAERLLPSLDGLMTPLDDNREQIGSFFDPADRAVAPFVRERAALRAALAEAPSSLGAAQTGLRRGQRLLLAARRLSRSVDAVFPSLTPGLRATGSLLRDSPPSLTRARGLLTDAVPTVPAALRITRALKPVLPRLDGGLADAIPMLQYIGPRACDIENFGVTMRSMTGFGGEGTGPLGPLMQFRAQVIFAPETLAPLGTVVKPRKDQYAAPCRYLSKPYPSVSGGAR
ncbi:MlaD family protein [Paraconexibacter sp.]|uniref:MlaD family protein n=1 Tax=Paraconexibacter sp. TaxID=2949640 RepID=UPI003565D995